MGRQLKKAVFKFKPFSLKQKKILTWWLPESPVKDKDGIIADGAIRSGKTVSMALSFVMWAMFSFEGETLAMCGKTIGSFRRNVMVVLKLMLWSRGYKYKDHRSDNLLEITFKGRTNYFYIFGGKDERSQDLIQGITLAGILFDEVALMPESFVNQAMARCSVTGSKYWFNCNPQGPHHWFKVNIIDRAQQLRLVYLQFTMDDNLSLSEEIKERYRRQFTGVFYERYIRGRWVVAEGVIYSMFDAAVHIVSKLPSLKATSYVSCDYGTQNATVFLLWKQDASGTWYCTKVYGYSGKDEGAQKTDAQYADDLQKWLDGEKPFRIVVDPSAASFIAELKQRGYRTKKANNDVVDGIRYVAALLSREKIKFYDCEGCEGIKAEFAEYAWDPKAADQGEDKPIKQNDHYMDAVRYFCYTILKRQNKVKI